MKNKSTCCLILVIALAVMGSFVSVSALENNTGVLTVVINDFPDSQGFAMVAVSNSAANYQEKSDKAFARDKAKVENNSARLVFKDLPHGEYAVSLYHDQNSNGKMDKNAMGIPKEAYAFSNNVRGMFGKPDWSKVSFKVESAEKQISISFK